MFELSVRGDFASAHQLKGYPGRCKDLHGHTWKVEVIITSDHLDPIGMVADFKDLKRKLRMILDPLDHVFLNELPAFREVNPSTENIAKYLYHECAKSFAPLKLKHVQVWESDSSGVVYYE